MSWTCETTAAAQSAMWRTRPPLPPARASSSTPSPHEGCQLTNLSIFNPNNEIDVSRIQLCEHGNDLYELVMIDHDIIMTCYFEPIT